MSDKEKLVISLTKEVKYMENMIKNAKLYKLKTKNRPF